MSSMRKNLFAAKIINKNIISFSINHLLKIYIFIYPLKEAMLAKINKSSIEHQDKVIKTPSSFLCVIFDANCVTTLALSLRSFSLNHPTSCFGVRGCRTFFFFRSGRSNEIRKRSSPVCPLRKHRLHRRIW